MFAQKRLVVIALLLSVCAAQTETGKLPEPESIDVFFYLESGTQTLKQLPKEDYKKHRGGAWSITDNVKVAGAASSFQIANNEKPTFVFKASVESAEKAKLFRFTVKGTEREYELGKWKRRDFTPNEGLSHTLAKFGDSSYKLIPDEALAPGEYALVFSTAVFTFGISPSSR
jgi:hypothetical protein